MKDKFLAFFRGFWRVLSHNIGLKLLSLLFAVLLWSFVVSSNSSITRTKTISGIDAYITNQSVLTTYDLALAEDPSEALENVSVRIEVPQASYALASQANVQVTLDLSSVRSAGVQEGPLKASTAYGRVTRIMPESITLAFESLDSRSVPVNAIVSGGKRDDLWYRISRRNPDELTISGASSVVQSIVSAYVYVDVTDRSDSFVTASRYLLLDSAGNEISQDMLRRSSTSITVGVDVYPTKELPVSNDVTTAVKGQVAEGYEITSISIQPETITVAAESELLAGLTELVVEPVSVEGAQQSFSQRAQISSLTDFQSISAEQVYVNVTIAEETVSARVEDVNLSFVGKAEDLTITWQRETFIARVTGPKSAVEAIRSEGVDATVDLSGLGAGEYALPIAVAEDMYPGVTFEFEPSTVRLTLSDASAVD